MKIGGNEKCHACPQVLASVVFRNPVFRRYSGIPPLFRGVLAIPLVFRVLLFRVPVFRRCSVVPRVFRVLKKKRKNFMTPFYAWGSTASRLEHFLPLSSQKFLFARFINLRRMKG